MGKDGCVRSMVWVVRRKKGRQRVKRGLEWFAEKWLFPKNAPSTPHPHLLGPPLVLQQHHEGCVHLGLGRRGQAAQASDRGRGARAERDSLDTEFLLRRVRRRVQLEMSGRAEIGEESAHLGASVRSKRTRAR